MAAPGATPGYFLQVVGKTPMAAVELFRQLQARGFYSAMHTTGGDREVRVVVGPYFDLAGLRAAKPALEA
ncbi:MAG TPA: hypothetical protein DEH78_00040, partial [Solibacterales bacterium]|nr:hypothetical protein [Bryobacterales bacterium]